MSDITCAESDILRKDLSPWASCTNFVGGEVLNPPPFPPHTRTEWCDDDEVVRLIDTLDADGCRHESFAVVGEDSAEGRRQAERERNYWPVGEEEQ